MALKRTVPKIPAKQDSLTVSQILISGLEDGSSKATLTITLLDGQANPSGAFETESTSTAVIAASSIAKLDKSIAAIVEAYLTSLIDTGAESGTVEKEK